MSVCPFPYFFRVQAIVAHIIKKTRLPFQPVFDMVHFKICFRNGLHWGGLGSRRPQPGHYVACLWEWMLHLSSLGLLRDPLWLAPVMHLLVVFFVIFQKKKRLFFKRTSTDDCDHGGDDGDDDDDDDDEMS